MRRFAAFFVALISFVSPGSLSLAQINAFADPSTPAIRALAFSHNSDWLAVASSDNLANGILQIIDVASKEIIFEQRNPEVGYVAVEFSKQGLLAVGQFSKNCLLIDVKKKQVVRELVGHDNHVRCVKFSSDGSQLFTGSYDRTVKVWKVATGELLNTLDGHPDPIYSLALTSDDSQLAVAIARSDLVWLWDFSDLSEPAVQYKKFGSLVPSIDISSDDRWLAAASWDGTTPMFRLRDATRTSGIDFKPYGGDCVKFSFNRKWFAVGGKTIILQPLKFQPDSQLDARIALLFDQLDDDNYQVRVNATEQLQELGMRAGTKLFTGLKSSSAEVRWRCRSIVADLISMKSAKRLEGHQGERIQLAFSRDDRWLASGDNLGNLKIWDTKDWRETASLRIE